jgi:hypothetical protein
MNNSNALYLNLNKRVNAIKDDIETPEYSSETESQASVNSLPDTSMGTMEDMVVEGVSAVNLVSNGDFSNGITNFAANSGTVGSLIDQEYVITELGVSTNEFYYTPDINFSDGDKLFIAVDMLSDSSLDLEHYL